MSLKDKSIIELRSIAQGLGITIQFSDGKEELVRKIDNGLDKQLPPSPSLPPNVPTDMTLRTRPPSKNVTQVAIMDKMTPLIARGLKVTFPCEDQWHFAFGKRSDSGTLRMPMRVVIECANNVMKK